jgi:hypothetical protein
VPVANNLCDLREKYEWAKSHPQMAKLIIEQGKEFMWHLMMLEELNEMYQKTSFEPVQWVIETYVLVSSSWKEVQMCFISVSAMRPGRTKILNPAK